MGVSGLFKIKDLFFMQMSILMKKTSDANGFVSKEIIFQKISVRKELLYKVYWTITALQ